MPVTLWAMLAKAREFQYRSELTGWTPDRVIRARDSADMGSLVEAADCVETLFTDDRIDGVLSTRTHGLLGLPLYFSSGSETARKILAGEGDVPGEWWSMHDEAELVKLQSWGLILGVGLAQRIPRPRIPGQLQRYRIEVWSPRWLRYDSSFDTWYVNTSDGEKTIYPGDGQWILYTPYGSHRPWASGKWNALVFPWLLKRFSLEDRGNHSQTAGSSTLVSVAPQGSTEKQRKEMARQFREMSNDSRFVIPEGWDLKYVEATGRTWDVYTEQIGWADKALTIVLAGQTVTTEGSQGFASGNVQDQIKDDFIRFDSERLSTCLRDQSLIQWAIINWSNPNVAPWPIYKTDRPANLDQQSRTFEQLGRAMSELNITFGKSGYQIDSVELSKAYGIPIKPLPQDTDTSNQVDIPLAPTDIAKTVRVGEVRGSVGLPPLRNADGTTDPRNDLMVSEIEQAKTNQITTELKLPPDATMDQILEAIRALRGSNGNPV